MSFIRVKMGFKFKMNCIVFQANGCGKAQTLRGRKCSMQKQSWSPRPDQISQQWGKKNWCRPDCTSLETKRGNQSHTSPNLPVNSRALIVLRPALMSAVTSLNDKFPKNITGVGEKQDSDVAEAYLLKMNILFKNSCSPKTLLALPAALHIKRFKKRGQNRVCPALK